MLIVGIRPARMALLCLTTPVGLQCARTKDRGAALVTTDHEASLRIELAAGRLNAHDAMFQALTVAVPPQPGVHVHDLAHQNGICTSLINRLRRGTGAGTAAHPAFRMIPVRIAEPSDERLADPAPPALCRRVRVVPV